MLDFIFYKKMRQFHVLQENGANSSLTRKWDGFVFYNNGAVSCFTRNLGDFYFYTKMRSVHAIHENGANSIFTFDMFDPIDLMNFYWPSKSDHEILHHRGETP